MYDEHLNEGTQDGYLLRLEYFASRQEPASKAGGRGGAESTLRRVPLCREVVLARIVHHCPFVACPNDEIRYATITQDDSTYWHVQCGHRPPNL